MFICLDCLHIFEETKHYTERHNFDSPPYEEWNGCPSCSGAYTEAYECDECGVYITSEEYAETKSGLRFCEECYQIKSLEDL